MKIRKEYPCPNCGSWIVDKTDSDPDKVSGTITEICIKCGRRTVVNKQLVI